MSGEAHATPGRCQDQGDAKRRIVLLSDGTGNSAAKQHKTHVWRLYRALKLDDPGKQIAFYEDGVGSKGFLPFKLLGGAFGFGLRRNVLELYMTLCRTYREGDRIYLFGFSRGAFTVRMLAGLIACRGLCTQCEDEDELWRTARQQFGAYRSRYKNGYLHRLWRLFSKNDLKSLNEKSDDIPPIEFIGAWDTVDAYGFPVYELVSLWDRFISPLRFVDEKLSKNVKRACHALSIDEERASFRPLLWNETKSTNDTDDQESDCKDNEKGSNREPRIKQVWFAGVHADVGGGYPRRELALVTLHWMISKVDACTNGGCGLEFIPAIREDYEDRANRHGVQHDSRAGLRAYYRYKPRDIEQLCREQGIESPKVHRSVIERIQKKIAAYAPTALPHEYEVVDGDDTEKCKKCWTGRMKEALRFVRLRRWLYAAFVVATLTFGFLPLFLPGSPAEGCVGWICVAGLPFRLAAGVLPDSVLPWIERWIDVVQNPLGFVTILATAVALPLLKYSWFAATRKHATAAWTECKKGE